MTRINKKVFDNEVQYTYAVSSKSEAYYKVYHHARLYKDSTGAFSGYDRERGQYTITIAYAR